MNSKDTVRKFINPRLLPVILFTVIPFTCIFGLIVLLMVTLPTLARARKAVAKLERNGQLDQAAAELTSPAGKTFFKGKLVLTDHYVFCKKTGYVFSYDEILWAYKHRHKTTLLLIPIQVTDSVYIAAKGFKPRAIASKGKDKTEEIPQVIVEIYGHNPNCLVGYTDENLRKYKVMAGK